MPQILAFLPKRDERQAIERAAAGRHDVRICVNALDGLSTLRKGNTAAVVWDITGYFGSELTLMLRLARERRVTMPELTVRVDLSGLDWRALLDLVAAIGEMRFSLRRAEDIVDDVNSMFAKSQEFTPECSILRRLLGETHMPGLRIVGATILAGKRRMTVSRFAALVQVPKRTLESQARAAHVLAVEDLLGWSVSLWTTWRIQILRWPLKRASLVSGFPTSEAAANYVERHVGARPSHLDFAELLDRFVSRAIVGGSA
ncbi:MAG TPA: hypothetical protein VHE78_16490 [Gemmatimonadaceae bacterium]|nr:hypothetical protein [Gemmatimonadaceae bacterium]